MAEPLDYEDVIVIGGGTAGLHAAITAAEDGWRVRVVDPLGGGGRLANLGPITGWPLVGKETTGPDVAARLLDIAMRHGVEFTFDEVISLGEYKPFEIHTISESLGARRVVIASGRSDGKLGIAGETEMAAQGISHCAACDGPLYVQKVVAVIGDSDWAVDEALHLSEYAAKVMLITGGDLLDCGRLRRERVSQAGNIELFTGMNVTALNTQDRRLCSIDVHGRAGTRTLEAAGLFPLAGWQPSTAFASAGISRRPDGSIVADESGATNVDGIFAVGDVSRQSVGSLLAASGSGVLAGMAASRSLARL